MITDDLYNKILIEPAEDCDSLKIITGYASPAMANRHILQVPNIDVNIIVGMAVKDGIGIGAHEAFKNINSTTNKFNCNYVISPPPVHIKTYVWLRGGRPKVAFTGSGNYSQNAFFGNNRESFSIDDPMLCYNYFESLMEESINCLDQQIPAKITLYSEIEYRGFQVRHLPIESRHQTEEELHNCVILPLVQRNGKVHPRSGLNWGQRDGRDKNQAYIPIPIKIARLNFFPARGRHFTIITDDGKSFDCVVAQDGDKAIETTRNNSILGRYFRTRLGVGNSDFVSDNHLNNYGRNNVKICKIDSETYFMDFSVTN